MTEDHGRGRGVVWSVGSEQGGWRGDNGAPPPKTDALQAAPHHSLSSVTAKRGRAECKHRRLAHVPKETIFTPKQKQTRNNEVPKLLYNALF